MATTLVDVTGNVHDHIDGEFTAGSLRVFLKYNTTYVVDPDAGVIRLGSAKVTPAADGSFTLPDVIASVDTVENLQATVYVEYRDTATQTRLRQPFGPYDLTAETGTVDLTELEEVQHLDPSFVSVTMAQMQALLDAMEEISGLSGEDSAVAGLVSNPLVGPLTNDALEDYVADQVNETVVKLAGDFAGANDRAKVVAAIAAAQASGATKVILNRRPLTTVWDFSGAAIAVPSGIEISAEPGVTINVSGPPTGVGVFTATGTEGTKTALTTNAAAGSLSAALPTGQGANFAPGDLIAFEADVVVFGTTGRPREIQRIVKISTDTVYFSTPLLDSYNTADSATFSKITPVTNVTFSGLRFTNTSPLVNTGYAIRVILGEDIRIEDFHFADMGGSIELRECIDVSIDRGTIDRLRNYGDAVAAYGYGIDLVGACSSITVSNVKGRSMRHLFTTVGDFRSGSTTVSWGYPKHIIVSDCIGTADSDSYSVFDTHEAGRDITFNNCVAIGGGTNCSGFQMRAKDVKLNNCTADRNGLRALNTTQYATGLRVNGGHYTRAAGNGMSLQANDMQVFGADVSKSGNAGIVVLTGLTDIYIKANIIRDSGFAGSAGYGIHDQGATGAVYDGNIIPKSTTQVTSILSLQATSVASNNICMGYGANSYGFTSANASAIRRGNNGDSGTEFSGDVNVSAFFRHSGTQLGLFGAAATTKKTITGSRGGNAALASLLTQGALMGYWTDGTTA